MQQPFFITGIGTDVGKTLVAAIITEALNALGRSGVPTYAIYPASPQEPPQVLPEVLTPGIVLDAIQQEQQKKTALLAR